MRNTTLSQGAVAKTLHWLTALGFPAVYCTIYDVSRDASSVECSGTIATDSSQSKQFADVSQANYFIQPRIPRVLGVRLAGFQESFVLILTGLTGRLLGVSRAGSVSMPCIRKR